MSITCSLKVVAHTNWLQLAGQGSNCRIVSAVSFFRAFRSVKKSGTCSFRSFASWLGQRPSQLIIGKKVPRRAATDRSAHCGFSQIRKGSSNVFIAAVAKTNDACALLVPR
jgi:hypothetical protein